MLMKMWRNWNSHIAGGNVKWCSCCLKKLTDSSSDPAILLLVVYPEELKAGTPRDICTPF